MRYGLYVLGTAVLVGLILLAGCGGDSSSSLFLNVSERPSWGSAGRIALSVWGANEIRYIYSISQNGGNPTLLTLTDSDSDWSDEGGQQPAYRPDGAAIAITARRGSKDSIYLIDAATGDRQGATLITQPAGAGADSMPSWSPDGSKLVFVTTTNNGTMDLMTVNADGTGRAPLLEDDTADLLWPVYTPDGGRVMYERRAAGSSESDIHVVDVASGLDAVLLAGGFDDGAPAVYGDRTSFTVLFHSNRNGPQYDIWAMDVDATTLAVSNVRAITQTSRSDGFPVWSSDGTRVAFNRDREVWTMAWTAVEADRDYKRLTRRYR